MSDSLERRYRWASIPALVATAVLLLTACGSSASIPMLDTGKIERAIAQSSLAQRGQYARVSCPSAVPQIEGLEFSCMARVGSVGTRFVVVQQDGSGRVRFEAPLGQ
jgi:hypothetical protein